jgi:hypothetical protein
MTQSHVHRSTDGIYLNPGKRSIPQNRGIRTIFAGLCAAISIRNVASESGGLLGDGSLLQLVAAALKLRW